MQQHTSGSGDKGFILSCIHTSMEEDGSMSSNSVKSEHQGAGSAFPRASALPLIAARRLPKGQHHILTPQHPKEGWEEPAGLFLMYLPFLWWWEKSFPEAPNRVLLMSYWLNWVTGKRGESGYIWTRIIICIPCPLELQGENWSFD